MPSKIKSRDGRAARHKRITSINRPGWTQNTLFAYKNMYISGGRYNGRIVKDYKWA